jgi:hypothetical protein
MMHFDSFLLSGVSTPARPMLHREQFRNFHLYLYYRIHEHSFRLLLLLPLLQRQEVSEKRLGGWRVYLRQMRDVRTVFTLRMAEYGPRTLHALQDFGGDLEFAPCDEMFFVEIRSVWFNYSVYFQMINTTHRRSGSRKGPQVESIQFQT